VQLESLRLRVDKAQTTARLLYLTENLNEIDTNTSGVNP
jgi:hypothetical protein